MLADSAQVHQGKLFLMGAGVAAYYAMPGAALQIAIGGTVIVPYSDQHKDHTLLIELFDIAGKAVKIQTQLGQQEFKIEAHLNVALPPYLRRGQSAAMPFAVQFPLALAPGEYQFRFLIDNEEHADARLPLNIVQHPLIPKSFQTPSPGDEQ